MSLSVDSKCLLCHLERNVRTARALGTEEQATAFARDLMKMYLAAPQNVSSPWFAPQTAQLFHDHYGLDIDRFRQEKADSNRFVLERLPRLQEKAAAAVDPVLAGLKLAILGNYLDFSALQGKVNFGELDDMLDKAMEMELDASVYNSLCRELSLRKTLLYLTDNAGEIGFDRVFAEMLHQRWPHLQITFCVRGGPALNDATREDAALVGVPFPVIDNGNCIPGTQLDMLSQEAKDAIAAADVIFAKGMANVETMLGCGYNVYYAFLVKCQRFVDRFQKPLMTPMLVKER